MGVRVQSSFRETSRTLRLTQWARLCTQQVEAANFFKSKNPELQLVGPDDIRPMPDSPSPPLNLIQGAPLVRLFACALARTNANKRQVNASWCRISAHLLVVLSSFFLARFARLGSLFLSSSI